MALTLTGNGQITTDNFTVGSDGTTTINNDIIANKNLRLYTTDDQANQWYVYTYTDDTLRMNYNGAGSDEVILDTNGIMRKPSNPWFDVKGTGGWTSFAANENIMTGLFSSGTLYQNSGGGFNQSNSTYTAPVAGRYVFMWHTYTRGGSSGAAGSYIYPRLYKNGSPIHPRSLILHYTTGTNYDLGNEVTILTDLAANDTIVAGFWSNNTSSQYYGAALHLQMYFVG
tara:strand:+ start:158 stop:838 length:681 start_codon:yes stop_codon:yes gene_type:complete